MTILLNQHLMQEQERFLRTLSTFAQTGDEETIFLELGRLRASIPAVARELAQRNAPGANPLDLNDLQLQMHHALDEALKKAIEKLIECRVRTCAEQAQRDAVTGLFNRAAFERRLTEEIERARRYRRTCSIILFDIDHFKSINDRFGHPIGDQALRQVSQTLQSALRRCDAAFRYGGDEFAAICPETNRNAALTLIYRIESNFKMLGFDAIAIGPVSVSCGVATFPTDAAGIDNLIRLADQRLYECKKRRHQALAASAK